MKLPRDLAGSEVARMLARHYGYRETRTSGSHMRLRMITDRGRHNVTVPKHRQLRVGTLDAIISDVAEFHGVPKHEVRKTLFG